MALVSTPYGYPCPIPTTLPLRPSSGRFQRMPTPNPHPPTPPLLIPSQPLSPSPHLASKAPPPSPLLPTAGPTSPPPHSLLVDLVNEIERHRPCSAHEICAFAGAGACVRASTRGASSSWSDRGAGVACLGFAVAALQTGHGSSATRKVMAPMRASKAVVHHRAARRDRRIREGALR